MSTMNSQCIGCESVVRDREMLCCSSCNKPCHYSCAGMTIGNYQKMSATNRALWKCVLCNKPKRRKGDETPVRETPSDPETELSPNALPQHAGCINLKDIETYISKQIKAFTKSIKNDIASFKNDIIQRLDESRSDNNKIIKQLTHNISRIETQQKELITTQKQVESSLTNLASFYEVLKNENNKLNQEITKLKHDNNDKLRSLNDLERQVDDIQRTLCSKSIELRSVPISNNENLQTYLQSLCNTIGVKMEESNVVSAYRSRSSFNNNSNIIFEFKTKDCKQEIIAAIKKYSKQNTEKLNTLHIGLKEKRNIFISELLTKQTKQLFYKTREFARTNNYQYCWTTYGRIYIRKSHGSAAIPIRSELQLRDLRAPSPATCSDAARATDQLHDHSD